MFVIIIFKTLSSLLFIFSSSQKILYSHRLLLEIVTVFLLILSNLLHKGNIWEHLSEFFNETKSLYGTDIQEKNKDGGSLFL